MPLFGANPEFEECVYWGLQCVGIVGTWRMDGLIFHSDSQLNSHDDRSWVSTLRVSRRLQTLKIIQTAKCHSSRQVITTRHPATVTPLQANWGAALGSLPADGAVAVDSNGMAQCTPGASGTYIIGAWINLPVKGTPPCPSFAFGAASCNYVLGTAKLTCP